MAGRQNEARIGVEQGVKSSLRFNSYSYNAARSSLVTPDGEETRFRAKTLQVFELLASNPNEVVTRDQLVSSVWGDIIVGEDTLNQSIREIRKALDDSERSILETLPRQGYILHAEEVSDDRKEKPRKNHFEKPAALLLIPLCVIVVVIALIRDYPFKKEPDDAISVNQKTQSTTVSETDGYNTSHRRENTRLSVNLVGSSGAETGSRLVRAVVSALARYSSVVPVQSQNSQVDYILELSFLADDASLLNAQLHQAKTNELILAENLTVPKNDPSGMLLIAGRVAALIGSPAGGAIGDHLLKTSRNKPVDSMTRPECLAHGYGCTTCSGEFDTVTPRAVECLRNILEKDPEDPDAWALKSTIYSRQFLWGSALQEPMRSDKSKRTHLKAKAVQAATRAEALSNNDNPSVYWGMVQAYLASCDGDKMRVAVERGVKLNPLDPNILGAYGNFISYAGQWEFGKQLVEKALAQETRHFRQWWYMAPAKRHYRRGEYQQAYDLFIKSFNERNWLSHLQLAYTLPHLGRIEEAKKALEGFMRVAPSMTREHVYEFYKSYCFEDDFLHRIKTAFDLIDMPSRGSADDFQEIRPVRAEVEQIGNRNVEYVDVGEGSPVVFVHGAVSDYRTWGYLLLPVSERYRFISYSLRYFGTLDWRTVEPQLDEQVDAQDLIEFIESKELPPVYLVGWSRSGSIVSEVARRRPDLVQGLIIYEPVINGLLDPEKNPNPPSATESPDFSKVAEHLQQQNLDVAVKEFYEQALERNAGEFQTEPTMLQGVVLDNGRTLPLMFSKHNVLPVDCDFINSISVPGLILYGENTNLAWKYMSKRYAECLTNGNSIAVSSATHDGPVSQPQLVAKYIHTFIEATSSKN